MKKLDLEAGLSIVVPFYNEGQNTSKSVGFVLDALKELDTPWEVIVVNDGSTDGISKEDFPTNIKYLKHEHSGRFKTRYLGLIESNYSNILFIDARVWLDKESLSNLRILISENPNSRYWNGYITVNHTEKAQVSIWETLVLVGWGKGVGKSETLHFGLEDFDRYPKGTTLFFAPKEDLVEAFQKVDSLKLKTTLISDDTKLLRFLAAKGDIWIDSKFSAEYQPRTTLLKFLRNGFYRGQTFVDSYWYSPTIFGKLVRLSLPLGVGLASAAVIIEGIKGGMLLALSIVLLSCASFFLYSFKSWKSYSRACKESALIIPLLLIFGAGFVKAYVLGFRSRLSS